MPANSVEIVSIYQGQHVDLISPEYSLATGSVRIAKKGDSRIQNWNHQADVETANIIKKVTDVWKSKGITNYMIFAKNSKDAAFEYEVVPYPTTGWRLWKQLKVLWRIIFGGFSNSVEERKKVAHTFISDPAFISPTLNRQIEQVQNVAQKKDAFCNMEVINKQRVKELKEINVLRDYADKKLHFLIIPKEHKVKFTDLREEEVKEVGSIERKIISYYEGKGFSSAYVYDKTGEEAGQTIAHWHRHVVFTKNPSQDFFGKLMVLKNMLFGSSPLSADELRKEVETNKNELRTVL